jgi:hypothetical protein
VHAISPEPSGGSHRSRGGFVFGALKTVSPKSWRLYFRSLEAVSQSQRKTFIIKALYAVSPEPWSPYPRSLGGYISEAGMLYLRSPEVYISGALEASSLATYFSEAMEALSPEPISLESGGFITGATKEFYNLNPGGYVSGTLEIISIVYVHRRPNLRSNEASFRSGEGSFTKYIFYFIAVFTKQLGHFR